MSTKNNIEFIEELAAHVGIRPIYVQSMMSQKPIGQLTIDCNQNIEKSNRWVDAIRQRYPDLNHSVFNITSALYKHKQIHPNYQHGWSASLTLEHYNALPLHMTAYLIDSMDKSTVILNDIFLNTIFQGLLDKQQYSFTQRQSLISILKDVTQLSNKDIAQKLFLSPETVKAHLKLTRQKKADYKKYRPIIVPTPLGTVPPF